MEYTLVTDADGKKVFCGCKNYSIKEFAGFCEVCWLKLTSAERAALKGTELPQVEVVVKRERGIFQSLWNLALNAAVIFLLFRAGVFDWIIQQLR